MLYEVITICSRKSSSVNCIVLIFFSNSIAFFSSKLRITSYNVCYTKLLREAFEENNESIDLNNLKVLLVLSIATSIDALAAGITFSSLKIKILLPSLSIGFITFVLCFIGVYIGCRMSNSSKIRGKLDIFGGSILIIIGLKIV